jgi:hypothetical protein
MFRAGLLLILSFDRSWLGLRKALQPVVGDRLPRGGVGDICTPTRAHAWIPVEGAQSHTHLHWILGVAAEEMRAAPTAEALLVSSVWMAPSLQ